MLGYVVTEQRGVLDDLLADVAGSLAREGVRLAGTVQENPEPPGGGKCDMYLRLLGEDRRVCISQRLGAHASGCRLDSGALETVAGLVERHIAASPQLLIVNKFGKTELDGRGFRTAIALALGAGIPVLTAVGRGGLPGFDGFAAGLGTPLPAARDEVLTWCRKALAGANGVAPT